MNMTNEEEVKQMIFEMIVLLYMEPYLLNKPYRPSISEFFRRKKTRELEIS